MKKKIFTGILVMQVVAILTVFGYLCCQEPKIKAARKAVSDAQESLAGVNSKFQIATAGR